MGSEVCDPLHIEGDIDRLPGLGLLPVSTTIGGEKVTRQVRFSFLGDDAVCSGYEIHMGITLPDNKEENSPVNRLEDGTPDGYFVNDKCFGTYIHGILDNKTVIDYILEPYAEKLNKTVFDYKQFKEEQYDKLADHVRKHVDMDLVYKIMTSERV